jgi:hypothetical protein
VRNFLRTIAQSHHAKNVINRLFFALENHRSMSIQSAAIRAQELTPATHRTRKMPGIFDTVPKRHP